MKPKEKEVVKENFEKIEELAQLGVTQKEISVAWNELDKQRLEINDGWIPLVNRGITTLLSPKNDGIYQLIVKNLWEQKISKDFPQLFELSSPSLDDYFDREVRRVYDFKAYWGKIPGKARYQYAEDFCTKYDFWKKEWGFEKIEPAGQ
jgi:hypothetical protein